MGYSAPCGVDTPIPTGVWFEWFLKWVCEERYFNIVIVTYFWILLLTEDIVMGANLCCRALSQGGKRAGGAKSNRNPGQC